MIDGPNRRLVEPSVFWGSELGNIPDVGSCSFRIISYTNLINLVQFVV